MNTKKAGYVSRLKGFQFEKKVYDYLKKTSSFLNKIINGEIKDVLYVDDIDSNLLQILEKKYESFEKPENFKFELPIDNKRACDIIILYTKDNKLFNLGFDIKKSKNNMTQICRKSYLLLKDYLSENELLNLERYLKYEEKKRTWLKLDNTKMKNDIFNIINKLKYKWIRERFDNNVLYHNHHILKYDNKIWKIIDLEELLKNITLENMKLNNTNFVFKLNDISLLGIKPHGSSKWNDFQITIYKEAFECPEIVTYYYHKSSDI